MNSSIAASDGSIGSRGVPTEPATTVIKHNSRWRDVALLAAVPAVLIALFLLPESTRLALAFSYTDPTVVTAFTAHYVSASAGHLLANVLGFAVLASLGYSLSLLARRRRLFLVALWTFLVAFPFVLSGLNLAVPRNAVGMGFSGINMALFGYLPIGLALALRERFHLRDVRLRLPGVFFLSVSSVALLALPASPTVAGIAVAGIALAVPYVRPSTGRHATSARGTLLGILRSPGDAELVAAAAVVAATYPLVGFPSMPSDAGTIVNTYVHFLGFVLAFLVVYVSILVADFRDRDRVR